MGARDIEFDVKHESERARDDDLVLRQLGHGDVQGLARVGLRRVEGDALHGPLGLHSVENFLRVRGEETWRHGHGILCVFKIHMYTLVMAEGGYDPMDETTDKTPLIPKGGDDDDDEWRNTDLSLHPIPEEEEPTNPFEPGASSTPARGEEISMRTRLPPERQGIKHSTAETSFITGFGEGGSKTHDSMVKYELANEFPNLSTIELEFRYRQAPKSGGAIIEVRYHTSDKWYPVFTKSKGEDQKTLNSALPKQIKQAFGKSTTEEINETKATLQRLSQQEETQQLAFQKAEKQADEAQRLRRDMDAIRDRIQEAADRMQELENANGPLDKEAIQKIKDETRKLSTEHQAKRKALNALAKSAKEKQKLQQELNKTRLSKGETERRLGKLKARKDAIQPLDELKQKAAELNEHITEDIRIIEDENTSSSERAAAQERVAVRNEELEMINEEIEARERQRPLLERVKDIFKKYGWTLQAVVLAVGVVLSALALAGLNGLKAGTKAVGNGLKTVGQKLGSLLPGLIGSIVSFIFKAAGQVFSFLGEHAWLLILAVVAFFMERLLKRRRR